MKGSKALARPGGERAINNGVEGGRWEAVRFIKFF